MKSITYNPTVALSILLAAVFLQRHPGVEVKTTSAKGTDFLSKLEDNEISTSSAAVALLNQDGDSELKTNLELGIVAGLHDVTKFEHQFELIKIFNGDTVRQANAVNDGKAISKFLSSPAFEEGVYEADPKAEIDQIVDGPVTTNDDNDPDPNSQTPVETDVK